MAEKLLVRRHSAVTRITHWINVVVLVALLGSGLQIFNAHAALYWGQKSRFDAPWLAIGREERRGETVGVTRVGGLRLETTGLLGWTGREGARESRAFPAWATIPSWRDLGTGRHWHFLFAWIFVANGLVYWLTGLFGGHIRRDLAPTRADLAPRHVWREIVDHARLRFPEGEAARRYNVLQKLAYLAAVLVLLPLMVATGLTMSPGFNAAAPWMLDLFGGRQSARSIHFICANLIVLFVLAHLVMVLLSGVWNNLRSMITGRYAIEVEPAKGARP